ncbi:hypothetical protein EYZ11_009682 [Aspergillus tanneri]|uniref:Phytoene desaturase n=1 Tax=Aspergillus tanneri TaxID=1220188 RepID=A0A4S3JCM9_9EURO|nr:hypothetical protein EYZ11_009682 [Aspergillus tanneri]
MANPHVLVIGAGAGGVATATRLAKKGFKVTVVEKNSSIGGRCSLFRHNGFRFDQGPSLLLMPELFHETFADLDTTMEDEGIKLEKCEPNYRVWFSDGDVFNMSTDLSKMNSEIERHEGRGGIRKFFSFMTESGRHYELSKLYVLKCDFPRLLSMLRLPLLRSLFALHPFESIYSRVSKYFSSDKMRMVFTFASMYLGMSPFEAPATYSLLHFTELAHGIWYPVGGFQKVLEAIATIGKRLGVEYRLNSPVSSILVSEDGYYATGACLETGERLEADLVIVNADLVYAYNTLLPPSNFARSLQKRPVSCSSISFFWSFNQKIPKLKTHNIFLASKYKESFDAIFQGRKLPQEPSFYVNVPSRIDPTAAPEGKEAVIVLVPVSHQADDGPTMSETIRKDWDILVARVRETIFHTLEQRTGCKKLRDDLLHEQVRARILEQGSPFALAEVR